MVYILVLVLLFPVAASAQTFAAGDAAIAGFLSFGAGVARPATSEFTTIAESSDGDWPVYAVPPLFKSRVRVEHRHEINRSIDIAGGAIHRRGLGFALAISRYADAQSTPVTVTLDEFGVLTARGTLDDLNRTEFGVHLQMVYAVPLSGPFRVLVFGGPSRFTVKQDVLADVDRYVDYDLISDVEMLVASGFDIERTSATGWGGNAGADATYFVGRTVGVGALVRYSRATVGVPNLMLATVRGRPVAQDVDAGGFHVSGGLRVRF